VFGIVMREGRAPCAGHFRKLHGLIEAAVSHPRRFCSSSAAYCASWTNKSAPCANSTSRASSCSLCSTSVQMRDQMIQSQLSATPILISRGFRAVVPSYHQSIVPASLRAK
jgi:hypothetical protein